MADLAHSPTLAAAPSQQGERLAPGTQIGEYEITGFLGAGAMGEVYAGKHPVIGKRVAVKLLRAELAASPEAAERFIREARAANAIDHANVIDVFAFGRFGDRLYLAMDLVEGRSLRAVIQEGPVPLARAIEILAPVADALDAGHARGVVHRDLKPDNIMLADSGKVLVLDFGIAKLLAGEGAAPGVLTGQGTWLGTPGYMAPEQWSADGAGPASDRYALGMIAYELLAGTLPFTATSVPGMMEQHFRAEVPPLGSPADPVLAKMLAKDPEARYPTARAFVDALRGTPAPRRAWLPAVAGGSVVVLGIVAIVLARGGHDDPKPAAVAPEVAHEPSTPPGSVRAADGNLLEVVQFQGAWRLPDGQLRWFERAGAQVDVYKLDEVAGPRTFYKHYPFVAIDHGVAFASDDVVVDHRANDAACSQPVHLEYRYDPQHDALALHRPVVTIDIVDGHCVPRTRTETVEILTRVDQAHDALDIPAPRGPVTLVPQKKAPARKRPPVPSSAASNAPNAPNAPAPQPNAPPSQILQPQATVPIQQQGPVDLQKK